MIVTRAVGGNCNAWVVGDDREAIVIDAPSDPDAILAAVDGRRVVAVICTHAVDGHADSAPEVSDRTGAPLWLHPDDSAHWFRSHPNRSWDGDLADGQEFAVGALTLQVIHLPAGDGPVCIYSPTLGCVFNGGSDVGRLVGTLPGETVVHAGHGQDSVLA